MDTYGDTAVMHNDMQHSFYPSGFYGKPNMVWTTYRHIADRIQLVVV